MQPICTKLGLLYAGEIACHTYEMYVRRCKKSFTFGYLSLVSDVRFLFFFSLSLFLQTFYHPLWHCCIQTCSSAKLQLFSTIYVRDSVSFIICTYGHQPSRKCWRFVVMPNFMEIVHSGGWRLSVSVILSSCLCIFFAHTHTHTHTHTTLFLHYGCYNFLYKLCQNVLYAVRDERIDF